MKLPLGVVHRMVQHPASVIDRFVGRDSQGRPADTDTPRTIEDACIQPATARQVQLVDEGARAGGVLQMRTKSTVYLYQEDSETVTIVTHDGVLWRVTALDTWSEHTGYNVALLTRYKE